MLSCSCRVPFLPSFCDLTCPWSTDYSTYYNKALIFDTHSFFRNTHYVKFSFPCHTLGFHLVLFLSFFLKDIDSIFFWATYLYSNNPPASLLVSGYTAMISGWSCLILHGAMRSALCGCKPLSIIRSGLHFPLEMLSLYHQDISKLTFLLLKAVGQLIFFSSNFFLSQKW